MEIAGSDTTGNSVLSNRIYGNAGLGIDLVGGTEDSRGITANDPGDTDIGSNVRTSQPTPTGM